MVANALSRCNSAKRSSPQPARKPRQQVRAGGKLFLLLHEGREEQWVGELQGQLLNLSSHSHLHWPPKEPLTYPEQTEGNEVGTANCLKSSPQAQLGCQPQEAPGLNFTNPHLQHCLCIFVTQTYDETGKYKISLQGSFVHFPHFGTSYRYTLNTTDQHEPQDASYL